MRPPGRYDREATAKMFAVKAKCVVLVVADGNKGSGYGVATADPKYVEMIPSLLRQLADEMETDCTEPVTDPDPMPRA